MFDLILDLVEDFYTVEVRRLHRIFGGLSEAAELVVVAVFRQEVCRRQAHGNACDNSGYQTDDVLLHVVLLLFNQGVQVPPAKKGVT